MTASHCGSSDGPYGLPLRGRLAMKGDTLKERLFGHARGTPGAAACQLAGAAGDPGAIRRRARILLQPKGAAGRPHGQFCPSSAGSAAPPAPGVSPTPPAGGNGRLADGTRVGSRGRREAAARPTPPRRPATRRLRERDQGGKRPAPGLPVRRFPPPDLTPTSRFEIELRGVPAGRPWRPARRARLHFRVPRDRPRRPGPLPVRRAGPHQRPAHPPRAPFMSADTEPGSARAIPRAGMRRSATGRAPEVALDDSRDHHVVRKLIDRTPRRGYVSRRAGHRLPRSGARGTPVPAGTPVAATAAEHRPVASGIRPH